ncbi:MAG: lytic transglycosylase [Phaeovulum sp.]|uniref:transglycosylase SLT domain-containing protein n=1 Tax=Phaeovulum sp. TaxID=2934796 RepID=UPI00273070B9|nr:lytic transglycosylase [Phaeovulum sp.]MDP2063913.1 lytic transglycosylase [Phaeovulum sp.]
MGRYLWLALAFMVASCGGKFSEPRNLDNACALIKERPGYYTAMRRTERRWEVPVAVQMAIIHQESKFVGNARTPQRFALGIIPLGRQSSAYGYAQALDGTWDDYRAASFGFGKSRDDIDDATDFIGWYLDGTERALGIAKTDTRNQYLAYHEGRAGYARGSYRSKGWLLQVATNVAARAQMYQAQLASCNAG